MSHDIVIRGGLVVDGTGSPPVAADISIDGDRVTAIGRIDEPGHREIDARGKYVTPGFVDIHTHLDAQLGWDPAATSSCYHGITSIVLGNCGVTFAPCKPEDRGYLAELMESVEDIPRESIMTGLPWNWETYGEYLDALDAMPKGVNVGGMVGHCAVRYHAMGERSLDEAPAGADDIARMGGLVDEAVSNGALGFSTSRTFLHRVPDGRPVPGTYAQPEELLAFGRVLGRHGAIFEAAARLGERDAPHLPNTRREVAWLGELSRENGVNVTFGLAHSERRETLYQSVIDFVNEENAAGARIRPQTTSRGIGALFGIQNRPPFSSPSWQALAPLDLGERLARLADAKERRRLIEEVDPAEVAFDLDRLYVLLPGHVRYDMNPADSLGAHARRRGVSPLDAFIDLSLETDGRAVCYHAFLNPRMDTVEAMLRQPVVAMGLADSGAHVGQIMDASQPTWLLSYWVRERGLFPIEEAVRRWTSDTADLFGLSGVEEGRGRLHAGTLADVNVIDLDAMEVGLPEYVHDFPGGAGRYVQTAKGYDCTLVNGDVFMEDGKPTGNLAGRMLRRG